MILTIHMGNMFGFVAFYPVRHSIHHFLNSAVSKEGKTAILKVDNYLRYERSEPYKSTLAHKYVVKYFQIHLRGASLYIL